ncbi:MAG: hypothetical protein AAF725_17015 [Acidobacteriota bacterium]
MIRYIRALGLFLRFGSVLVLIYLASVLWTQRQASREIRATYEAMTASPFSCPAGAEIHIERWSKLGWSRSCLAEGVKDGPWQAWEGRRLSISGEYRKGRESGQWSYFDAEGGAPRLEERGAEDPSGSGAQPN